MAISLSDSILVGQPKPIDDKYYNTLAVPSAPYTSVNQVNSVLLPSIRYQGLTVNINGDEYWYYNGTANNQLVLKGGGSGSGFVPYSGATQDVDLGVFQLFTPLVSGSSIASGILTLESTSNLTKGFIYFGANSAYDENQTLLGINTTFPTASLDLPVGTTQHAPLKLSPLTGTNFPTLLTTPQEGAIEYDLNKLYFTLADTALGTLPARQTVILDKNLDGVNIEFGSVTGTQLGTNPNEKLSFWGTTPITQPSNVTPVDTLLVSTGLIASGATSYSFTTDLEANALIKTGGLGTEYLMADGTVTTGVSGGTYQGPPNNSTVVVGNFAAGTLINNLNYNVLLANIYAPYNAPSISATAVPLTLNYNATQTTTPPSSVFAQFTWTKAVGTPDLISAVVEFERPAATPPVPWTPVTFTTFPTSFVGANSIVISSSSILLNPSTPDNATINFRVTCIDGGGTTIGTTQTTFLPYVLPTANLTLVTTPPLQNGKYIRPLNYNLPNYQVQVSGTITRNSPNINISNYILERSYTNNVGSYTTIVPTTLFGPGSGSITPYTDTTPPAPIPNFVYMRISMTDTQNPGGQSISNVGSFPIYRPIFFGFVDPTWVINDFIGTPGGLIMNSVVNSGELVPIPNGSGGGLCNYSNTPSDRFINNILLTITPAAPKKFCFAYPAQYGALSGSYVIKNNATFTYIQGNFVNNTILGAANVTFPDGSTILYFVYLYTLVVTSTSPTASTTYDINICPTPC